MHGVRTVIWMSWTRSAGIAGSGYIGEKCGLFKTGVVFDRGRY